MFSYPQPVQVIPWVQGKPDPWGGSEPGWGEPIDLLDAVTAPRDSSESTAPGRENRVITGLTLMWTDPVTINPKDRVRVNGEDYEVVGEAGDYRNDPFSGPWAGQQVALKRVEG